MFNLFSYKLGMIQGQNGSSPEPSPEPSPALYTLTVNNQSNYTIKISFFREASHYTEFVSSGATTFQLDKYGIFVVWAQNVFDKSIYITATGPGQIIGGYSIYAFSPDEEDTGTITITDEMPK